MHSLMHDSPRFFILFLEELFCNIQPDVEHLVDVIEVIHWYHDARKPDFVACEQLRH